ncbi:HepT-like ribonuclease domain-containing protein [Lutispora sp.]|uniref:HepT-like ribonuclease domain-containing protein n=1 Tax=Lutispora sp. TaxID=2828727 RepID=UPI002B1EF665|nr:HepT-like ribonuclease domain-containing protein [Lutispora sp.]MEA4962185.1 HepT-like ribonuclease domain-containing protein [Lutispora sp.]
MFLVDEKTKRATSMTLIIIGELVKNLTDELKSNYTHIPCKAISGMRDIAAHKYQTIKMGDVWITLISDIPYLKADSSFESHFLTVISPDMIIPPCFSRILKPHI